VAVLFSGAGSRNTKGGEMVFELIGTCVTGTLAKGKIVVEELLL
jgi:hypothetical protein